MTIRPRMSSCLDLIGPEQPELFALELKKKDCYIGLCLVSSIYNFEPISTKLFQNIYNYKTLDEFDYGSNWIRKTGVICP